MAPINQNWAEWKRLALEEYDRIQTRLAAQGGANSFGGSINAAAKGPVAGRTRSNTEGAPANEPL